MFCVTRVDDNPQNFGLFKAKQRENPKKDIFNPRILSRKAKLLQRALRFLQNSTAPQPHLMEERNFMYTDKERLVLEINYCEK